MAKTTTCPITQNIRSVGGTIVNGTSFSAADPGTAPTNTLKFYTAGAEGSVVKSVIVTSSSTSAHIVQMWVSYDGGTTKYLLTSVSIPAGAGFLSGTTLGVDLLAGGVSALLKGLPLDQSGTPVLPLAAAAELYFCVTVGAVTASKNIYVTILSEDY